MSKKLIVSMAIAAVPVAILSLAATIGYMLGGEDGSALSSLMVVMWMCIVFIVHINRD